jgi:hypothetical protein
MDRRTSERIEGLGLMALAAVMGLVALVLMLGGLLWAFGSAGWLGVLLCLIVSAAIWYPRRKARRLWLPQRSSPSAAST